MKYVVAQNQSVLITGTIAPAASAKYAGTYTNQPVLLKTDFLQFEEKNSNLNMILQQGINLNKLDKGEQNQIPAKLKLRSEDLYYHTQIDLILSNGAVTIARSVAKKYSNNFYSASYINDIFRPPKFI